LPLIIYLSARINISIARWGDFIAAFVPGKISMRRSSSADAFQRRSEGLRQMAIYGETWLQHQKLPGRGYVRKA
jgi:hypothetical protein